MSVFKRYRGKRLKARDKDWAKGTWYVWKRLNGRVIHRAIPEAQTKEQAELAERKIVEQAFNRRYGVTDSSLTVKEFANGIYLRYCEQHNPNLTAKKQSIAIFTERLGRLALVDVTPQDCRDLQHFLRRQMADSSVNRIMSSLAKMFRLACEEGKLDRSPTEYVKRLDEPPPREPQITPQQKEKLWETLQRDVLMQRLVTLATNLPLRKGQFFAIDEKAIDLDNGFLKVIRSKGQKPRVVPLNETASSTLRLMLADGQIPFPLKDIRKRWTPILIDAGINKKGGKRGENFTFHDLRHYLATELIDKNNNPETVRQAFDHSDMRITRTYIDEDFNRVKAALNSLDATNLQPTQEIDGPPN